ncbi:MAG: tol-pal system protein YbgF [Desulfobacterales bacterium]|nr:tol-pal system protein YbgF [Desulfobacterales bacterium]
MKQTKPDFDISILQKQIDEVDQKVEDLLKTVSVIQTRADEQERIINDLKNGMKNENEKDLSPSDSSPLLKSAEELYNQAFVFYKDKSYEEAHSLFISISSNYPKHKLADNALYWAGECLYDQKKFSDALFFFEKVIKDYPESDKVADSLLKIGYTYMALGDPASARIYLIKVVRNHPFSPSGAKAEEKLKNMKMD